MIASRSVRLGAGLLLGLLINLTQANPLWAAGPDSVPMLLAQSRAAMGGEDVDRHVVLKATATISVGGISGTQTSWREIAGRRYAQTSIAAPFETRDGFDGRDVWNADGSGLVWAEGGEAGRSQEIMLAYILDDRLWTPGHGGAILTFAGSRTVGRADYDAIVVSPPDVSAPFELWFDRASHLPARAVQPFGPATCVIVLTDYRPEGGLMVPHALHVTDLDGNESEIKVVSVLAVADGEDHLKRPASRAHDFSIDGGRTETSVPMEVVDNHVFVPVMLNGKGPFRFILDTGSENVLDPMVARDVGASGEGDFQGGGSGAEKVSLSATKVALLQVAGARLRDQVFSVAPVRKGFGIASGQPVDGLIGFELLSRLVTTFDYAKHRLVLTSTRAYRPPSADHVVPFVLDDRTPQFACTINAAPGRCTLDTGSRDSVAIYGPFAAAHPEILPAEHSAVGVDGFGFGGPALGRLGRLKTLEFGSFALPGIVANFSTDEEGVMARPFLAGNVGGGVWRRFTLTLDYGRQEMSLRPNATFAEPDVRERAGLFLISRDGDYRVLDVRPDTPAAEAGITKGDVVESVNGVAASSLSVQAVRDRFLGAPRSKVSLGLRRKDGSRRTVVFTLRTIV